MGGVATTATGACEIRIVSGEDAHERLIATVRMPSSMSCERECQWQALDQTELCVHSTAHDRFQEWVQAGVFLKLWQAGIEQFEELCGIDWDWLSMDGAMTRAPLGGGKNRPQSDRARQERGETQPAHRGARRPYRPHH